MQDVAAIAFLDDEGDIRVNFGMFAGREAALQGLRAMSIRFCGCSSCADWSALGDFSVPLGHTCLGPALGDQQGPLRVRFAQLDPDLVHRRLDVAVGDRALLGDNRDRLDLAKEVVRELVDLRLSGFAAREHAEIDADVSLVVEKSNGGNILH